MCWPSPVVLVTPQTTLRMTASSSPRADDSPPLAREDSPAGLAWGTVAVAGTNARYLQAPLWPAAVATGVWPNAILLLRARVDGSGAPAACAGTVATTCV